MVVACHAIHPMPCPERATRAGWAYPVGQRGDTFFVVNAGGTVLL